MAKVVKFNKEGLKNIVGFISKPIVKAKPYFNILGIKIDQDVQTVFRNGGQRKGLTKWEPFSFKTLFGSLGSSKFRKRPGTDKSKTRRYSFGSKMLQASGGFRQSFKALQTTDKKLVYGSRLKLAGAISSNPIREVVAVTSDDRQKFGRLFVKYYSRAF